MNIKPDSMYWVQRNLTKKSSCRVAALSENKLQPLFRSKSSLNRVIINFIWAAPFRHETQPEGLYDKEIARTWYFTLDIKALMWLVSLKIIKLG